MDLPGLSTPLDVLTATPSASAAELAKRGQIQETAQKFEASFLGILLQSMFKEVKVSEPFGGGDAEEMWKSFFTDALARQMAKAGGVGLAQPVAHEMLKLQGLA
jgi:Rod binding domain-containing protein